MEKKIVAIIGRPNVGKSTLFNRLTKSRKAIVHPTPGVTRDRNYHEVEWADRAFYLVDTGGILPHSKLKIDKIIRIQAEIAIEQADAIIFLVDIRSGLTEIEMEIARMLHKEKNKVFLVANKTDKLSLEYNKYEFMKLGFGEPFTISAEHGRNIHDFLDELLDYIPETAKFEEIDDVKVAIVGKPNVGKSSIANRLIGFDSHIVHHEAGTTRDAIDSTINYKKNKITFIDTAGLRKKTKVKYGIEYFSNLRALNSVERADITILVIDATEDISSQEKKIAVFANRHYKNIIVVFNKFDLVEKYDKMTKDYTQRVQENLPFLHDVPVLFTSALHNKRIFKILDLILEVNKTSHKIIEKPQFNESLKHFIRKNPPTSDSGKHIVIFSGRQVEVNPPKFVLYCNDPTIIPKNYRVYLRKQIRKYYKYVGVPIIVKYTRG